MALLRFVSRLRSSPVDPLPEHARGANRRSHPRALSFRTTTRLAGACAFPDGRHVTPLQSLTAPGAATVSRRHALLWFRPRRSNAAASVRFRALLPGTQRLSVLDRPRATLLGFPFRVSILPRSWSPVCSPGPILLRASDTPTRRRRCPAPWSLAKRGKRPPPSPGGLPFWASRPCGRRWDSLDPDSLLSKTSIQVGRCYLSRRRGEGRAPLPNCDLVVTRGTPFSTPRPRVVDRWRSVWTTGEEPWRSRPERVDLSTRCVARTSAFSTGPRRARATYGRIFDGVSAAGSRTAVCSSSSATLTPSANPSMRTRLQPSRSTSSRPGS